MRKVEAEYCILAIGFSSLRAKMVLNARSCDEKSIKGAAQAKGEPHLGEHSPLRYS